jgi:hypothetical protein
MGIYEKNKFVFLQDYQEDCFDWRYTNVGTGVHIDYGYSDANKFGVVALVNRYCKTIRWYTKSKKPDQRRFIEVHDDGPKHFW